MGGLGGWGRFGYELPPGKFRVQACLCHHLPKLSFVTSVCVKLSNMRRRSVNILSALKQGPSVLCMMLECPQRANRAAHKGKIGQPTKGT